MYHPKDKSTDEDKWPVKTRTSFGSNTAATARVNNKNIRTQNFQVYNDTHGDSCTVPKVGTFASILTPQIFFFKTEICL